MHSTHFSFERSIRESDKAGKFGGLFIDEVRIEKKDCCLIPLLGTWLGLLERVSLTLQIEQFDAGKDGNAHSSVLFSESI